MHFFRQNTAFFMSLNREMAKHIVGYSSLTFALKNTCLTSFWTSGRRASDSVDTSALALTVKKLRHFDRKLVHVRHFSTNDVKNIKKKFFLQIFSKSKLFIVWLVDGARVFKNFFIVKSHCFCNFLTFVRKQACDSSFEANLQPKSESGLRSALALKIKKL